MKKVVAILLVLAMILAVSACKKAETYEIALVTDVGNIDDKSFNQGAWEGVKAYAEANSKTYNYYRPSEDSTQASSVRPMQSGWKPCGSRAPMSFSSVMIVRQ